MNKSATSFFEKSSSIVLLGTLTAFDPISIDMYLSAFPKIASDFKVNIATVEISLSAFFVGLALGQLIYGPLADNYGRKKPLIIGMLIYIAASIGCFFSTNIYSFIFFRILQALGGCAGMVITRAIVSDVFEKEKSANIFSLLMLVMGISPILAPTIGGHLTHFLGWRSIFISLAILSTICVTYTYVNLPETKKIKEKNNSLKYFLSIFPNSFKTYFDLSKDTTFISYALSGGLSRAVMFAYITGSPFVFITYFDIPADRYGWIFGVNAFGIIGASQINRFLLKHFKIEKLYESVVFCTFLLAGVLLFNSIFFKTLYSILVPLFLLITSLGLIMPNSAALSLSLQGHRAGSASALLGTIQWSIAFLSSFLVSYFHSEGPLSMVIVIFVFAFLSFLSLRPVKKINIVQRRTLLLEMVK